MCVSVCQDTALHPGFSRREQEAGRPDRWRGVSVLSLRRQTAWQDYRGTEREGKRQTSVLTGHNGLQRALVVKFPSFGLLSYLGLRTVGLGFPFILSETLKKVSPHLSSCAA